MYNPDDVIIEAEGMDWTGHPFRHFVQSQEDGWKDMNDTERRRVVATYYAQVTFVDKAVGMLVDKLKELELEKKTVVFFTSDHGDWGGRYGQIAKTGGFQEPLIRIAGILRIPSMSNGQRINAQISNIDIMPTIFDYLSIPYPCDVQGKSFLSVLKGEKKEHRDVIFAEVGQPVPPPEPFSVKDYEKIAGPRREKDVWWFIGYTTKGRMAMIRKDGWKYCYYTGDLNELYDLENDPFEKKNLANNPNYRSKHDELKNELMEWLLNEPVKGI
jgi:arylsulfatase A-like enzyme